MPEMSFQRRVQTGTDALDFGVQDLETHVTGLGTIVYASTGFGGGVSSYFMSSSGVVSLVGTALFDLGGLSGQGAEVEVTQGGTTLLVGGISAGRLISYDVSGLGQIGARDVINVAGTGSYTGLAETDAGHILTADTSGTGVLTYTWSGDALQLRNTESDTAASHTSAVVDVKMITLADGAEIMLAASQDERGISSYRMAGFDPVLADTVGPADGVGIMIPTDMTVLAMGQLSFVLVASAPSSGSSGALTVMQIGPDGQLTVTDHLLDNLDMRFGGVQAVDALEVNGRWYVAAGGGDQGISLFSVMPGGVLQHLDTIADSTEMGLGGVTALTLAYGGGDLQIFAASGTEAGLTQLSYDLAEQGQTRQAASGGQTLSGSSGADILAGQGGADLLLGGAGQDTLMDGAGEDTLTGGTGADVFVIAQDGVRDTITDFKVGEDSIDLSFWSFLYSADALDIARIEGGVRITHRGEVLDVMKGTNGGLNPDQVREGIQLGPARVVPVAWDEEEDTSVSSVPSRDPDLLLGTSAADELSGFYGNDTIYGYNGDDLLIGGMDRDEIRGGIGDDTIRGGNDSDTLLGEEGDDYILGGDGEDFIRGGDGQNKLFGQRGNDTLNGGDGYDTLNSGGGADRLLGYDGNDWFRSGNSSDTLYGGKGNDTLFSNSEDDEIYAGAGNDRVFGGGGDDYIVAGSGNDYVKGGVGADTFVFSRGMDRDYMVSYERGTDVLRIDSNLLDGETEGWQVVQNYAYDAGKHVIFDFGGGDEIVFAYAQHIGGFSSDIEIF